MPANETSIQIGLVPQIAVLSTANSSGIVQRPLYGQLQADGSVALEVAVVSGGTGGSGGTSNTVSATAAGTSAATANPVQGVTGGVPLTIVGSTGSTATPNVAQLSDGVTPTQKAAISAAGALKTDNSAVTQPVSNTALTNLQFDAGGNLKTTGGAGGTSNTVAATSAGATATTANPIQGVTGGVAVPVSGTFFQATQPVSGTVSVVSSGSTTTPNITQLSDGVTPSQKVAISAAGALKTDNSGVTQPVSNASLTNLQFDASNNLKVNIVTGGGAGGTSNTVAATAAGTTATTANPIQGVTGGVPLAISGSTGSTTTPNVAQLSDGTTPTQKVAISAAGALKTDNSGVTQPVSNTALTNLQFDGSGNLKTTGGAGGSSNTVAATSAGTSAATANPIQGVTGGVPLPVSGALGTASNPNVSTLRDGASNVQATVAAFHSADNQQPGSTAYGILTGGVAQLLNSLGNLDRQTEASFDGISQRGIATGSQQMASPFSSTSSTAITAGSASATIVVSAVSGTNRGAPWSFQVGSIVSIDITNDYAYVTAISGSSVTLSFKSTGSLAHSGTYTVKGFVYNQARDATIVDGSTGQGISSSATQLFNSILNSGLGGWEAERSAAGELDGASGTGTAIAAAYEYNGGATAINSYDRERNVQGKAISASTLSSAISIGSTTVTLSSVSGLTPGSPLYLEYNTGNQEISYVSPSYVPGSLSVGIQTATTFSHANAALVSWDVYGINGPGLSGILPTGIGLEEDVVYNAADGKFYLERSATADGMPGANLPAESMCVWNGTTFDRTTGSSTRGMDVTAKNISFGTSVNPNVTQLISGSNAIGQVGGKSVVVELTPSISTLAYASGNVVGGLLTFPNALLTAQTGILQSITIRCKTIQTAAFKFYLFRGNPTNSTWTDRSTPAINSADVSSLSGIYPLASPDSGLGTHTIYCIDSIGKLVQGSTTNLYGVLVVLGTSTFATSSDLIITLGMIQD